MTARREIRSRRTLRAALGAAALVVAAAALAIAGGLTLANSKAGEVVASDGRLVVALPDTPNAALAIVDDRGRLTGLIIATLAPVGIGGSLVTVPVNADASIGLGSMRRPLDRQLDLDDPAAFFEAIEGMLAVSLQFGEIVAGDRLIEFVTALEPLDVDLPENVFDTDSDVDEPVMLGGEQTLDASDIAVVLQAMDERGDSYDHHDVDVEMWSAMAIKTPLAQGDPLEVDEFDRLIPPASLDEVFNRLWRGDVQVRDLAVQTSIPSVVNDSVLLDRRDALLVFAQASPGQMSTPNAGPTIRLIVPYSDEQIAGTDGLYDTRSEVARTLIGELLFFQANIVSVDSAPAADGAKSMNTIEVADPRYISDMETLDPVTFGGSNVSEADTIIDGVDITITLGESYLALKRASAGNAPAASDSIVDESSDTPGDTVDTDG